MSTKRVVRIYCAGKIRKSCACTTECSRARDWRPLETFRIGGSDYGDVHANGVELDSFCDADVVYVGPFTYGCDHGCSHGPTSHGNGLQRGHKSCQGCECRWPFDGDWHSRGDERHKVYQRSLRQIDSADLVIARPEVDSFGTLLEIGYAAKAGKSIVVDLHGQPEGVSAELWFATQAHRCTDHMLEDVAIGILGYGPGEWGRHAVPAERPDPNEAICESPIELELYRAMRLLELLPTPQVQIGKYRVDFAIGRFAIECDGHEYHSSREQRTHDAERDRALMAAGYQVIRFTGTEIHRDAIRCASEVDRLTQASRFPPSSLRCQDTP